MSKEKGIIIIAPISLLLLLAQSQVSISMIRDETITGLVGSWEQAYALLASCSQLREGKGETVPNASIATLDISLFLPLDAIDELLEVMRREGPHPLKAFVEEVWALTVIKFNRQEGKYYAGNSFRWDHLPFRDASTGKLLTEWADSRRIRRGTKFGDPYFINLFYGREAGESKISWETTSFRLFGADRIMLPTLAILQEGHEFPVPVLPFAPVPTITRYYPSTALRDFATFYRDEFNRLLEVVEWHGPYLLLRETEVYDMNRETKEGMEKWAEEVALAKKEKAAKLAKAGKPVPKPGPGELEPAAPQPLVMSVKQQEEVRVFLKQLENLWDRVTGLVDVRSTTGYTNKELVEIFEELARARVKVDQMAAAGYKMFEINAVFYPTYDKFENFVTPRRMDEWYFGNVATSDEGGGQEETEQPAFFDIIVKDEGPEFQGLPSVAGIQSLLSLVTESGRPARFFTITPGDAVREDKLPFLQEAVVGWLGKVLKMFEDLACRCLTLNTADRLLIDMRWGDILANEVVRQVLNDPAHTKQTIARWFYDSTLAAWEKLSEQELKLYNTLRARDLGQSEPRMNPVVEALEWLDLKIKKPALYNNLASEYARIRASQPKGWAEEYEEQVEAEVAEIQEREHEQEKEYPLTKDGFKVMEDDGRYVRYQDADGNTITTISEPYRRVLEEAYEEGDLDFEEEDDDDLGEDEGEEEEEDEN